MSNKHIGVGLGPVFGYLDIKVRLIIGHFDTTRFSRLVHSEHLDLEMGTGGLFFYYLIWIFSFAAFSITAHPFFFARGWLIRDIKIIEKEGRAPDDQFFALRRHFDNV
jgi:hypothetical protein